ncbi:MAG: hypothetical protein LH645_13830 [Actinomycetia bacterium]|nr:hypothetical protein [Actinomycetes bacterium]
MTNLHADRSYDDLPESDVATVLQVPLLWGPAPVPSPPTPFGRPRRRSAGRHRSTPRRQVSTTGRWIDHPLAHTAHVGLVSAALVLALSTGVLLALALWLP